MATVEAIIDQSVEEARAAAQGVAGQQGYSLAESEGNGQSLLFKKGTSMFSWGSRLYVTFQPTSPGSTQITIVTGETFAITDWGRGQRAAYRLLDAIGATY